MGSNNNEIGLSLTNNENVIQAGSSTVVASIPMTASLVAYPVSKVVMVVFLTEVIYSDSETGEEATLPVGTSIHCSGVDNIYLKTAGTTPVIGLLYKGY